jgi:ribosome production factor 2
MLRTVYVKNGQKLIFRRKPKNARSKRALEKKEAKVYENTKQALFLRGPATNQVVNDVLRELAQLKKPDAVYFTKKNQIRPFEDAQPLEFLSQKNDASLIVVGNHMKKRPQNLCFVRMFDYQVMDMFELGVEKFEGMHAFAGKGSVGMRPMLAFSGDLFDHNETFSKIKNYFMDFYRGSPTANQVDLRGLEYIIHFIAEEGRIYFRVYCIKMKKSGTKLPRVELEEMGPRIDFVVRRTQFAPPDIMKEALRVPKEIKVLFSRKETNNYSQRRLRTLKMTFWVTRWAEFT